MHLLNLLAERLRRVKRDGHARRARPGQRHRHRHAPLDIAVVGATGGRGRVAHHGRAVCM